MEDIVSDSKISVVIQGPLYLNEKNKGSDVRKCIESVRKALPGSKIIVSTWEDERKYDSVIAPMVDKLVYSCLSPAIVSLGHENNITRQIASTKAGLAVVETQYVLKMRANLLIKKKTAFFTDSKDRINLLSLVGDPVNSYMLFVLPDFIQFGKTGLMRLLWGFDIPKNEYYMDKNPPSIFDIYSFPHSFKFSPEQYLGIAWARNRHKASPLICHQFDVNYTDFLYWKDILSNDFNFFSAENSGFIFSPSRYLDGNFFDVTSDSLKKSSRLQFAMLLTNKYILFVFKYKWWRSFIKYILFIYFKPFYWSMYNSRK